MGSGDFGDAMDGRALAELLEPRDDEHTNVVETTRPFVARKRAATQQVPTQLRTPPEDEDERTNVVSELRPPPVGVDEDSRTSLQFRSLAPPLGQGGREEAPTRVELPPIDSGEHGVLTPADSVESKPGTSRITEEAFAAAGALPRGTAIGRYLIVEPLGAGGLGDVYTAYDPELDRRVAVKVLRPTAGVGSSQSGTLNGRDRLVREAKAMARLAHPNVVAIHDVGRIGDEVFIAMERVEGKTLAAWLREAERPWKEVRDVFLAAGAGLAAAHAANIIHRDFKPQNVIVGADGRPRVLDFGLARSLRKEQSGLLRMEGLIAESAGAGDLDTQITVAGLVMGTPQFMAPEQFEGASSGAQADQFSFCVALWKGIYRERPFQGENMPGLIKAVREGKITEPKDRRGVPKWMHKALLRGLAHDPEKRHPSMEALLHALQRDKRSRRRNWFALAFVGFLSAGGAGAGALFFQPPVTDEALSEVEALVNEAHEAAARSYYVYPSPADPDAVTSYRKVLELEDLGGQTASMGEERATELRTEFSETLTRLGDRYYEREGGRAFAADYYAAALIFDPDNAHARDRTTLTPGEVSVLRGKAATGDFTASELSAAASLKVLAIEDEEDRVAKLSELFAGEDAPSLSTAARLEAVLGEAEADAIEEATEKRRAKRRKKRKKPEAVAVAPPPPPEPEPALVEGETEGETDGVAEGGVEDIEAPVLGRRKSNPDRAADLAKQGMAAFKKGQFDTAEGLFHRALGEYRRNAKALGGLAELYFERGSYQKALSYASKAVSAAPRSGKYRIVLGDAYFKTYAYESARREYEKAKDLGHPSASKRLSQLDKRLGG